ncbi:MAG: hypothetical protein KJ077_10385 [Anaerolineae bacterium]|nr:hypothetical protein [Anaerolineae bacterium]
MPAQIILKDENSIPTPPAGYTAIRVKDGRIYVKDDAGIESTIFLPKLGTYAAGDSTPSVANVTAMVITNASPTTITALDDGVDGQHLILRFADANTTIRAAAVNLPADYVSEAGALLHLVRFSDGWYAL